MPDRTLIKGGTVITVDRQLGDFFPSGDVLVEDGKIVDVGPELGRIDRAAQQFSPDSDEMRRRVQRLFTIFRFDTALLILIVLDMTAKPSF